MSRQSITTIAIAGLAVTAVGAVLMCHTPEKADASQAFVIDAPPFIATTLNEPVRPIVEDSSLDEGVRIIVEFLRSLTGKRRTD